MVLHSYLYSCGHGVIAAVLLLQSCQSGHNLGIHTEEPSPERMALSGIQVQEAEGPPPREPSPALCSSVRPNTMSTSKPEHSFDRPSSLMSMRLVTRSSSTFDRPPQECDPIQKSTSLPLAQPAPVFFGPLTSWSGDRVVFNQRGDVWYARTAQGILPVKSRAPIEIFLPWLSRQDVSVIRPRIHILPASSPLGFPCVYLGRLGLLGGSPVRRSSEWQWLPLPRIKLDSDETRTLVHHIPSGHRYIGYRELEGSAVQRASCTICYVVARSIEALSELKQLRDVSSLEAGLAANAIYVMNLGELGGGVHSGRMRGQLEVDVPNFAHSALWVCSRTKRNKWFKTKSRVDVKLEVCVVPESTVQVPGRSSSPRGSSPGDGLSTAASEVQLSGSPSSVFSSPKTMSGKVRVRQQVGLGLLRAYEERLTAAERDWASVSSGYGLLPTQQSQPNQAAKKENYRSVPAMAFGAQAWREYFKVDVDEAPLPHDIELILDRKSKLLLEDESSSGRVRDNHLLTLIPARVHGRPFTLDKLGELMLLHFPANNKRALGDNSHGYFFYSSYLTAEIRESPLSSSSYWVLLPKTILSDSRNKDFDTQKGMVAEYDRDGYAMPRVLEVATSIFSHYVRSQERLYTDVNSKGWWTYTRCSDRDRDGDPLAVGGFESPGLSVCSDDAECGYYFYGVSCCRKL